MKVEKFGELYGREAHEAMEICRTLMRFGHDAVIVGGPIRDMLMEGLPNDFDIASSATPDEVRLLFPRTFVQGSGEKHGTIGVLGKEGDKFEVTTFRLDVETDGRHATVEFTRSLEEDLKRRDFTCNAIAFRPSLHKDEGEIIDIFNGVEDLRMGLIRAVGKPQERFSEDYLRILRAYRFAAKYGFEIDEETRLAMQKAREGLQSISKERLREEFLKMMEQATQPGSLAEALISMQKDGIFSVILPEFEECHGVTQNKYHKYDVFEHIVRATDAMGFVEDEFPMVPLRSDALSSGIEDPAALKRFMRFGVIPSEANAALRDAFRRKKNLMRFGMLFHDIGKPSTRTVKLKDTPDGGVEEKVQFLGHEIVGAEMVENIAKDWKFAKEEVLFLKEMIREHMALLNMSNKGISEKALRGLDSRLGNGVTMYDLLRVRIADKRGSGKIESEVEPQEIKDTKDKIAIVLTQPTKLEDLCFSGDDVMETLNIPPSDMVGYWRKRLHKLVIGNPGLNNKDSLTKNLKGLVKSLGLEPEDLKKARTEKKGKKVL